MAVREGLTPIQLYLPRELKTWLRKYADYHDVTMTTVIKLLVQRERSREKAGGNGEKSLFQDILS